MDKDHIPQKVADAAEATAEALEAIQTHLHALGRNPSELEHAVSKLRSVAYDLLERKEV